MLNEIAIFASGFVAGGASLYGVAHVLANRVARKAKEQAALQADIDAAEKAKAELDNLIARVHEQVTQSSVEARLRQAMEITLKQAQLKLNTGDQEQLMMYNNLELEKITLLQGILKEGHDPVITIRFSKGDEKMPLSKYIASLQKNLH